MKSKAYLTCSRSVVKKRNNNIDNKGPFNDPRSIALRGFAFLCCWAFSPTTTNITNFLSFSLSHVV